MKACLIDLPTKAPFKVPVVLANETDHDVIIPQKCVVGEVTVFQRVLSKEHSVVMTESGTDWKPGVSFNFKGCPIDPKWKERIVQKLNSMPEVFAQNDPNFGRTDQIKHQIKLSDSLHL